MVGNGAEPKGLDPAKATGVPESKILYNLFEGLTSLHPITLEPIPGMAESWTISDDGKWYTFKIRANAKWNDGRSITAQDFVDSWRRASNPGLGSEYAYQLFGIKNAEKIYRGELKDETLLGVRALDPHTLQIELEHPIGYFLRLTSFYTLFPTPIHIMDAILDSSWTKKKPFISNGPFQIKEWKINRHIILEPNPHYWDHAKIKLAEIHFLPIEQIDTEEKTFFGGDLHITNDVPTLKIPGYKAKIVANPSRKHPYTATPYLGTYFYRFNTSKAPFNDKRVRHAFSLTMDRKLIVERVTFGNQQPATSFTPPNLPGYQQLPKLNETVTEEDKKEALRLMAEAGYPNGKGLPKIELLYNTSENHKRVAIALAQMWKKNLGVEIALFNQEWKVYLDSQRKMNFNLSRAGWIGDYPDPNTFLNMFVTDGSNNQTAWSSKEYDRFIAEAEQIVEVPQRMAKLQAAESILMEELPLLPIYFYTSNKLISELVHLLDDQGQIVPWQGNLQNLYFFKYYVLAKAN
jgi:oligopeptide transport system substrate-binding protein